MQAIQPLYIYGPPSPPKPALTVGIEIEFAIAYIPPTSSTLDPNPEDSRSVFSLVTGPHNSWIANMREHVAATLSKAGIKAIAHNPYDSSEPDMTGSPWIVKHDDTIKAPAMPGYSFLPIEINSPAFYYIDPSKIFAEIKFVLEILTRTYRIICNRSCGLHVHVGNANTGFAFQDMQNLLATLWTFEPQFETIHPLHRVDNQRMCPGFRRYSELMRNHTVGGVLDVRGGLEEILGLKHDFSALADITEPRTKESSEGGTRLAYHLGDVGAQLPLSTLYRRTVEFRQHKGTVDHEEIELWIRFCVILVQFCDSTPQPILARFLRESIGKSVKEMPLGLVLQRLAMPLLAHMYPKRIADTKEMGDGEEEELFEITVGMSEELTPR